MVGAYFLYMVALWMPFFPFLNITGIFICIGIGADDIFVFLEALDLAFRTHGQDAPLEQVLAAALYDAGAATLVKLKGVSAAWRARARGELCARLCGGSATARCDSAGGSAVSCCAARLRLGGGLAASCDDRDSSQERSDAATRRRQ